MNIWPLFGMGYIPHNVIIDHTMTVRYSAYGFNQNAIINTIETYLEQLPNSDADNDGIVNTEDNCPYVYNPGQEDLDNDGIGDVCDEDIDGDGCINEEDLDPYAFSNDTDLDGTADHCDPCDNLNIFVPGNVNGDVLDGKPIIDVFDIVEIVDYIIGVHELTECGLEAGDCYLDGQYNILDVVNLVNIILDNVSESSTESSERIKVKKSILLK